MATRAKSAKKSAAKKSTAPRKPASKRAGVPLAMSIRSERVPEPKPKPKSNYCVDHGRLLRADRTCPLSTCRFHDKPMPD